MENIQFGVLAVLLLSGLVSPIVAGIYHARSVAAARDATVALESAAKQQGELAKTINAYNKQTDELAWYREHYALIAKDLDEKNATYSPYMMKYAAFEEAGKSVAHQPYDLKTHNCADFTRDHIAALEKLDIMAMNVFVKSPRGTHAVSCVLWEPQSNRFVTKEDNYVVMGMQNYLVAVIDGEKTRTESLKRFCEEPQAVMCKK